MGLWGPKRRKRPTKSVEPTDEMESVRRTSSLPSGVFKTCDKSVEEALTGPVAEVFLSHMSGPTAAAAAAAEANLPPVVVEGNQVASEEIDDFLALYSNGEEIEVPDVAARLRSERMWVLADLATNGAGRARELATRELRGMVARMTTTDEFGLELLHELVSAIEGADDSQNVSVLLQVLLASARQALSNIEDLDE